MISQGDDTATQRQQTPTTSSAHPSSSRLPAVPPEKVWLGTSPPSDRSAGGGPPDLPTTAEVSLLSVGALKALLSRHHVGFRASDKKWKLQRLAQALVEEHAADTRGALEMALEWGRSADGAAFVVEAPMASAYESWCNLCGRVEPPPKEVRATRVAHLATAPWYKCVECVGFELCPECRTIADHPHRLVVLYRQE